MTETKKIILDDKRTDNHSNPSVKTLEKNNKNNSSSSREFLDQFFCSVPDVLFSHPLSILRLQCQANSQADLPRSNPISALSLYFKQIGSHGLFPLFCKGLQTNCAYITLEEIFKKVIIELVSEASGIDLTLANRPNISSSIIKSNITSNILKFASEAMSISILSPFYSSNLLIKVNSLIATENRALDGAALIDFFRVAFHRVVNNCDETEGFNSWAFSGLQLVQPTLLSIGTERILYTILRPFVTFIFDLITKPEEVMKNSSSNIKSAKNQNKTSYKKYKEYKEHLKEQQNLTPDDLLNTNLKYDRKEFYRNRYIDLITKLMSKMICYKFEVVSTKMHVQGARILVDNTDVGEGVLQTVTKFSSFRNTWRNTTYLGHNWQGFGFVLLEFFMKIAINYGVSQV